MSFAEIEPRLKLAIAKLQNELDNYHDKNNAGR